MSLPPLPRLTRSQRIPGQTRRTIIDNYNRTHDANGRYYPNGAPQQTPTTPRIPNSTPSAPTGRPLPNLKMVKPLLQTQRQADAAYNRHFGMEPGQAALNSTGASQPRPIQPQSPVGQTVTAAKPLPRPVALAKPPAGGIGAGLAQALAYELAKPVVNRLADAYTNQVVVPAINAVIGDDWMSPEGKQQWCSTRPGDPRCEGVPQPLSSQEAAGGVLASTTQTLTGDPPFTGGQSPGVNYRAYRNNQFCQERDGGFWIGPVNFSKTVTDIGGGLVRVRLTTTGGNGASSSSSIEVPSTDTAKINCYGSGFRVVRSDGLPDTGGDPPGVTYEAPAVSQPRPLSRSATNPPALSPEFQPPQNAKLPISPNKPLTNPIAPFAPKAPTEDVNPLAPDQPVVSTPTPTQSGSTNPQVDPTGAPTGAPAPTATPDNVPAPISANGAAPAPSNVAETGNAIAELEPGQELEFQLSNGRKGKVRRNEDGSLTLDMPTSGGQIEQNRTPWIPRSVAIPLTLTGIAIATGTAIKNGVDPAEFTKTTQPPTKPPNFPPVNVNCPCSTPVLNRLDEMDDKLSTGLGIGASGAGDSAIMAKLNQMQDFAAKAWEQTRLQKVMDALTLLAVLHNASMLSRNLAQTLGEVISQGLYAVGVKTEDGSPLDINGIIGTTTENWIISLIGADVYNDLRETYKKANRIIQVGTSIIWTIRSLQDASMDLMEWIGEHTGKIGNALKRFGVVGDRAYPWMSENPQAQGRLRTRIDKATGQIQNLEERVETYAQATSTVIELEQETGELLQQFGEFKQSVEAFSPDPWADNQPVAATAATETAASQSPAVTATDADKGSTP